MYHHIQHFFNRIWTFKAHLEVCNNVSLDLLFIKRIKVALMRSTFDCSNLRREG